MDIEQIKTLVEIANEVGANWRVDYCGRGMYSMGNRVNCFGITGDMGTLWDFCSALNLAANALADELGGPRSDSMGRDTIFYWPDVTISNEVGSAIMNEFGSDDNSDDE